MTSCLWVYVAISVIAQNPCVVKDGKQFIDETENPPID